MSTILDAMVPAGVKREAEKSTDKGRARAAALGCAFIGHEMAASGR